MGDATITNMGVKCIVYSIYIQLSVLRVYIMDIGYRLCSVKLIMRSDQLHCNQIVC